MPLIRSQSKKAFKDNIETEMKAHPEKKDQNLAIAYSIQRQAKRKKMASGGGTSVADIEKYADGGMVDEQHDSIADAIMSRRKAAPKDELHDDDASDMFGDINDDPTTEDVPEPVYHDEPEHYTADAHEDDHDMDLISKIRARMKTRRGL